MPYQPIQGEKAENQKEVIGAIIDLFDDLKSLVLDYANQGMRENTWSIRELPPIPILKRITTYQDIEKSSDPLTFLHILKSITEKLDPGMGKTT